MDLKKSPPNQTNEPGNTLWPENPTNPETKTTENGNVVAVVGDRRRDHTMSQIATTPCRKPRINNLLHVRQKTKQIETTT